MPSHRHVRILQALVRSLDHFPSRPIHRPPIHSLSSRQVFDRNVEIAALARAGRLTDARHLFDTMPTRDIVSWNAILTAHWQSGDLAEAKRLFDSMPERNTVSWNSMISACFEWGTPDEALQYFRTMPKRNVASWNAMISGLVKCGCFDEAEQLFDEMPQRNVISYTAMVDGFAQKGDMERASSLFYRMPKRNTVSWVVMISGFVENGRFEDAKRLFHDMPEKNAVAFTAMVTGYCKEGRVGDARRLFDEIHLKDLVSWNAMIAGYTLNGHGEEALKLHNEMQESGMKPDHATLISVLTSCSLLALLQQGRQIHAISIKIGLEARGSICNALIIFYSKCGSISDSELVFQAAQSRDLVSWNTIIAARAQHGHYEGALLLFYDMEENGIVPDGITFLSILSACGHAGKVDESLDLFDSMVSRYQIPARAEHYACLVDILSRAGQLEKAYEYIIQMPFEAEGSVWGALLGACQTHLNVDLGEIAANNLVQLDSQNSGAYVMLSNIYAAAGMWNEVNRVRYLMKEQGVKKQPGYSWTEISNKVHYFLVGDTSHPDIDDINAELRRIGLHMKMASIEDDTLC